MSVGLPHPEAENVGAYLLGALPDDEREVFERHLEDCSACRNETERLRVAAEALPRSVEPLAAPPALKQTLMAAVEADVRQREGVRPPTFAATVRERVSSAFAGIGQMRPGVAWVSAAVVLLVGVAAGLSISTIADDEPRVRTLAAKFDDRRVAKGSGSLSIPADRGAGATLSVHGMPSLPSNETYQVWVERDGQTIPKALFNVGEDGKGLTAVDGDIEGADSVMVTREPAGGARAPSAEPILKVEL
jgi:anti-sigma-K factor RskA